jgi:hypothetical protein
MSITDFLRNLNVHIDELEYIGNHGYVNGMTKMIMDRLKDMDITKRPIHCTDKKREVLYVKDDDKWEKEDEENKKIRKAIKNVAFRKTKLLKQFKEKHIKRI